MPETAGRMLVMVAWGPGGTVAEGTFGTPTDGGMAIGAITVGMTVAAVGSGLAPGTVDMSDFIAPALRISGTEMNKQG